MSINKERFRAYRKEYRARPEVRARLNSPKSKYNVYRLSARKRGIVFGLTFEQFTTFWQKPCHYCGGEIGSVGLDRVNSSRGYVMGNIVPCCTTCNYAKSDSDPLFYVAHCESVVKNLMNKNKYAVLN